jgi:hypothetical protein
MFLVIVTILFGKGPIGAGIVLGMVDIIINLGKGEEYNPSP